MKIAVVEGPVFFIRTDYLLHVPPAVICDGAEFSETDADDILDAGFCYEAERKAVSYLARAEQSRFSLTKKLLAKGLEQKYIKCALDYLEAMGLLSDERYARAWLFARKINHSEGRMRLAVELASRGISHRIVCRVLDDFFKEYPEQIQCRRALERCQRRNMSREKTYTYLVRLGFSQKLINQIINE